MSKLTTDQLLKLCPSNFTYVKKVYDKTLARRRTLHMLQCNTCQKTVLRNPSQFWRKCVCQSGKKENHSCWNGVGKLGKTYISTLEYRAKRKQLPFDLDADFLWCLYLEQRCQCAISGIEISVECVNNKFGSASVDRIDPVKGYIKDNVQWVHQYVNIMKWDKSQTELIKWCAIITEFQKDTHESSYYG